MDNDTSQYMSMFADEGREHLQVMNRCLLELDAGRVDDTLINEIFRAAHTLKGMSATMGFQPIAELSHNLENLLDQLRNKTRTLTPEMVELLFKGSDVLGEMVETAVAGGELTRALDLEEMVKRLVDTPEGGHAPAGEPGPAPASMAPPAPALPPAASAAAATDSAAPLTLNEFEQTVMEEARQKNFNVFQIFISLDDGCLLKVARVFMIFRELEALGDVLKSMPPVSDLEQENFQ